MSIYTKNGTLFWLTSSPRLTRHPDDESPVLGSTGGIYKVLTFSKRSPTNNCKRIHFLSLHIFQLDVLLTLTCSTLRGLFNPLSEVPGKMHIENYVKIHYFQKIETYTDVGFAFRFIFHVQDFIQVYFYIIL